MSFKSPELYGGAITVELPAGFVDASGIRQIPDHQEVYLDSNSYSSIVFDILERVEKPDDEAALQYHFADLIEGTGDETNVLGQGKATMLKMPNKPVYSLNYIQTPPRPDSAHHRKTPDFVSIHLLLLRLEEQATDITITINVPHYSGEYVKAREGEPTQLMKDGETVKQKILESFEIKDWGLFGEN
ncbi:Mog1p/PsbP-like protein [Lindgomyces ingoldianus]|uniref:Mog1p/PsbP-like protein n=1 Tax=Lindgomyces ingoldianus TaxID=673940 RepID=A0ACB6QIH2_9PLEO|nr:Mog1p/PsbP-like protein [Lindgomyces ingoldianus]KAF2466798.1 Mog1p/PsbP-like protein [Lindgomyces ingoldianus]